MSGRGRTLLSAACGVLGVTLILAGVLLGYVRRSVFDERGFSSRVAASLEDPRVAQYVGEQIADAVIRAVPDLVGLQPVLVGLARAGVSSPPFRAAVRRGARVLHRSILSGGTKDLVLTVQDLGGVLQSALATHPALAKKVPARLPAVIGRIRSLPGGALSMPLIRIAHRLRAATALFLVLGFALSAACVWSAREKRRAIVRLGAALMALALVLAIVGRFGGDALALFARKVDMAPPVAGIAGAFLSGLMVWAGALGFAGLVLAAAAASLLERVPLTLAWEHTRRWLVGPQPLMRMRLARGLIAGLSGAALLFWPLHALTVAAWLAGLVVVFLGLREAFVAALHMLPQIERAAEDRVGETGAAPAARSIALVAAVAIVLLAATLWVFNRSSATPPPAQEIVACNGSPLLCDRRLDQVAFPTTHNSMGGADNASWMFPNQSGSIPKQLEAGVRGFLIDVHYGNPVGDVVKTALEVEKNSMETYEAALGKEGVTAALRIRDRLEHKEEGPRDVYLCHGFCELGSLRFVDVLRATRTFLVENPGEVLVFVIQDESVAPQDIERCFGESGLIDFVYKGPARPPWPTLREMVDSDQRVLVMAENASAGVPWYHPAFEVMQETPYGFKDESEFSNRPNRGGTSGSLLLMNHWIETVPMAKPSNAAIVNAHDFLLRRARACQRQRRHIPNLVAVDFYGVGDLFQVVRELNGIPPPDTTGALP